MRVIQNPVTQERLKELFSYDPETGIFVRNKAVANQKKDSVAGSLHKKSNRHRIKIDGQIYSAHRLAWLYMLGEWPDGEIDHINSVSSDNRFSNLRSVSNAINAENKVFPQANNRLGILGVSPWKNKFRAVLQSKKKQIYLGCYETADEAHEVYLNAKRQLHEGCTI